ncbi:hypothetical protein OSB04_002660 [Centaurea solstitialis]|uniref:Reverse transcriptase/retrotransposon-derived protein RNase H-like domain-containing protein n=1 Tax=Centaurea solstitialis TaxID=347529 RepID=A0AA38TV66_9ASTR|nr:hypothetical protein OSB04_002660 [Centaurea solstitialis]
MSEGSTSKSGGDNSGGRVILIVIERKMRDWLEVRMFKRIRGCENRVKRNIILCTNHFCRATTSSIGIPTDSCVVLGFSYLNLNLKRFGLLYGIDDVCLILFVISNPKGEIVGCKIGLYPRSQDGAKVEVKGKNLNLEQHMLVKSERSIDHVAHLKQSFDILRQYKMKVNPTKCSFGLRAGKFLGYLVTQRGIEESPEQVKAITEIQSPRNIKEVQKLTGRVAALTRFISRSSDKCHLFYNVLRKNQGFSWTDEHEKALQELKQYMTSPPLLTKPVEGEILQLYLAVSKNATSAVLVREEDQQQRPIYYVSKSFLDAETRYTSTEKLLLGLMTAAKKLRHYFESHHIIVVTNYPLKTVLRNPELTGRLAKWSIYLSGIWRPWNEKVRKKARKREKCTRSTQKTLGDREMPNLAPLSATEVKIRVLLSVGVSK